MPKEKKKSKGKIKVSRVQRMLSAKANADRARTATVVDDENQQGLDFGDYRPPLTASAPSNIEGGKLDASPSSPKPKTKKFAEALNSEGNDERMVIERVNKLAATTQGRPQSSRARGIQAERARSGQRRPKLYKNAQNVANPYYIDPRAELEETNQELRRWENEMATPYVQSAQGTTGSTTGATIPSGILKPSLEKTRRR